MWASGVVVVETRQQPAVVAVATGRRSISIPKLAANAHAWRGKVDGIQRNAQCGDMLEALGGRRLVSRRSNLPLAWACGPSPGRRMYERLDGTGLSSLRWACGEGDKGLCVQQPEAAGGRSAM